MSDWSPTNMDDWTESQMGLENFNWAVWNKRVNSQDEDMNTSMFIKFHSRGDEVTAGVDHLCVRTMLIIISKRGAYLAHYWETISFNTSGEWSDEYGSPQDAFNKTVLEGLEQGVKIGDKTEQVPLNKSQVDATTARAYLIKPRGKPNYEPRWQAIRQKVGALVLALADGSKWADIFHSH